MEIVRGFEQPKSIHHELARALEDLIIKWALKPGTRLVETEISATYGVSRSPVREALVYLEHQRLVTREARHGFSVAAASLEDLNEIYACRIPLECLAVAEAAARCTAADAKELNRIMVASRQAGDRRDIDAYFRSNIELKNYFQKIAGNKTLRLLLHMVGKPSLRYRHLLYIKNPEMLDVSVGANAKIVGAIETGRAADAQVAMKELLTRTWEALASHLAEMQSDDDFNVLLAKPNI
jgi:DNA-binding GntR family transcriptional regulator